MRKDLYKIVRFHSSTLSLRKMDEPKEFLKLIKEISVEGAKQIEKEKVVLFINS